MMTYNARSQQFFISEQVKRSSWTRILAGSTHCRFRHKDLGVCWAMQIGNRNKTRGQFYELP